MTKTPRTRRCPETGKVLKRGTRQMEFAYKGRTTALTQPGWYATDGGDESLHSGSDLAETEAQFQAFTADVDNILAPAEVKAIRQKIGLSQREAGEILGGGPRSFQKYESGKTRLSVPMSNLLRLLGRDPRRLRELRAGKVVHENAAQRVGLRRAAAVKAP